MSKFLQGALKLHNFLYQQFWDGEKLLGPDCGVRFNRILWRFGKSYLDFVPWNDNYCYLQAQGYWVLCNWQLYTITGENQYADLAIQCANGILKDQSPEGYWVYPHPGWKGRIGTVEGVFAALGMLATYERTGKTDLLIGIQKWHDYLIRNTGFQKTDAGLAINYFDPCTGFLWPYGRDNGRQQLYPVLPGFDRVSGFGSDGNGRTPIFTQG
jgi:hypothetical protein